MDLKKTYGSFFCLDCGKKQTDFFSKKYIFLNTGRNALEYILRIKKPKKIFLPALSCDALYTPLERLNLEFEFYNVNSEYEPIFDYKKIGENDYFLYINYYGLKNNFAKKLAQKVRNLILDNTQAFFGIIPENVPTFNSLRKFFGVPDGALLFNIDEQIDLEKDQSAERFFYLIKRLEQNSEDVYPLYRKVEEELNNVELKIVSQSTKKVFESIALVEHKNIRTKNFEHYHQSFKSINKLNLEIAEGPHFYPLYIENGAEIKKKLVKEGIFIANFWPNVFDNPNTSEIEQNLVKNVLPLPIDSRYSKEDISNIISKVKKRINEHFKNH